MDDKGGVSFFSALVSLGGSLDKLAAERGRGLDKVARRFCFISATGTFPGDNNTFHTRAPPMHVKDCTTSK